MRIGYPLMRQSQSCQIRIPAEFSRFPPARGNAQYLICMKRTAATNACTFAINGLAIVLHPYAGATALLLLVGSILIRAEAQCTLNFTSHPQNQADCEGNQVNFTTTVNSGTSPFTYTWYYKRPADASFAVLSAVANVNAASNTLTVPDIGNSAAPNGTQYYVIATDANGCTVTSAIAGLTVNAITGVVPSAQNITICRGGSYSLTANTTGSVVSYQWTLNSVDIPGATSSTLNITNATAADNGLYKVVVVFNVVGAGVSTCQRTSQLVRNLSVITPALSGSVNVCANSSHTYSTEAGKTNYTWMVTGGTISSGIGTNSVNVSWGASGPGSITISYTDPAAGCTTTATSSNVTINPLPLPIIVYHN